MAILSGKNQRTIVNSIEVVTDDTQRVFKLSRDEHGAVTIAERSSAESDWNAKTVATLASDDADVVAAILSGSEIYPAYGVGKALATIQSAKFHVEPVIVEKKIEEGDCTPLDIERAKAANLREQKEIIQLELERDHAKDLHISADVPGCPACERRLASLSDF